MIFVESRIRIAIWTNSPSLLFDRNAGVFSCQFSACRKYRYSSPFQITGRAISLQKVHLWMDCGKRILWSWTESNATKIRAAAVQSSVWTLQQILPDKNSLFFPSYSKLIPPVKKMSFENGNGV